MMERVGVSKAFFSRETSLQIFRHDIAVAEMIAELICFEPEICIFRVHTKGVMQPHAS